MPAAATETERAIEAVWRIEVARLIARLARMVGDVGLAEDLAQDALVIALEKWPRSGVPENPGAWLMATAKNRAIDQLRRRRRLERKQAEIAGELRTYEGTTETEIDAAEEGEEIEDDLLRLIFITCHPLLSTEARVALTLRLLGGLTTHEIARGFLVSEPTVAQRIVRAKRTLAEAQVPFELPDADELEQRLGSVLEVVYLIFNEGYAASAGENWMRPELCAEALRLGRILAGLAPREPEVHGLVALMEIRAVAVAMAFGPAAGLELVDALTHEPALRGYHPLPSVRGDLLARLGRYEEAHAELTRAAALTHNARERQLLSERAAACAWESAPRETG